MKKFGTKIVALATVAAMSFAFTPAISFAATTGGEATAAPAEGSSTGNGNIEAILEKDVFDVVLPTIDDDPQKDTVFNFILDPQDLITEVGAEEKYQTTFTSKGLYFKNKDNNYSGTSDKLQIINKSTGSVDVSIDATVAGADGLTFATADEQAAPAGDGGSLTGIDKMSSNSIYLALNLDNKDNSLKSTTVFTANGASKSFEIPAASNAYKVTYNDGESKYEYKIDTSAYADDTAFYNANAGAELSLTGECNKNPDVDWTALKDITPSVTVKWTVDKHVDGYIKQAAITSANPVLNIALPSGVSISSVKLDGAALTSGNHYTYSASAGTVTFQSAHIAKWATSGNQKIQFTYSDSKTQDIKIQ